MINTIQIKVEAIHQQNVQIIKQRIKNKILARLNKIKANLDFVEQYI